MSSLQKIPAKRKKSSGKGASPSCTYRIQFVQPNGRRATICLGAMSGKQAAEVDRHVAHLVNAKRFSTAVDEATQAWLKSLTDEKLMADLVKQGLCGAIENPTVDAFVTQFIKRKRDTAGEGTIFLCQQVASDLRLRFGEKRVTEITQSDAKAFWHWLITGDDTRKKLAENTARRRLGRVREIFNDAIEHEIITRNPFVLKSLPVSVGAGKKEYVPAGTIERVIAHIPADRLEWKLLFSFGRYIGCRMPSEIRNLTWNDVNYEANTILLKSPKTARRGKGERLVPIFPEIRELLLKQSEAAQEHVNELGRHAAGDAAVYVFPTLRRHSNSATTAAKAVKAAGFKVWPKFWNSLRASCETDLMDRYGLRKACAWIGNSPAVAMKHYALLRKTDYTDLGEDLCAAPSVAAQARTAAHCSAEAIGNAEKPRKSVVEATPHGLENHAQNTGELGVNNEIDARSVARGSQALAELLRIWERADANVQTEILEAARSIARHASSSTANDL
jgi:integrase